jgi:hypothetical protein
MIDICLCAGLFCFCLFFYIKLRGILLGFLADYSKKISQEFANIDAILLEIEELKGAATDKLENLPNEKLMLLQASEDATNHVLEKKKRELSILEDAKIDAMQNSLHLLYKRKGLAVKKVLVQSLGQAIARKFVEEKALQEQNSIEEITSVISKI